MRVCVKDGKSSREQIIIALYIRCAKVENVASQIEKK